MLENVQSSYNFFIKKPHILNKFTVLYWAILIFFIFTELPGLRLSSRIQRLKVLNSEPLKYTKCPVFVVYFSGVLNFFLCNFMKKGSVTPKSEEH